MKVLYFLALVVLCCAAPLDSPPQNVKARVDQENGRLMWVANWEKVDSSEVTHYNCMVSTGKLYYSEGKKDDGSKMVEVVAPSNPEKPITKLGEYQVPASQNEFIFNDMEKGVVYLFAVQACTADGCGPFSENAGLSSL